jgi:hypothetical protein
MSEFLDRLLVELNTPANLVQLLDPPGDANHTQLRGLIDASFSFEFGTIHDVRNVQVMSTELERPIAPLWQTSGTWTQTTPSFSRTDVRYERAEAASMVWLDVVASISLTLLLEVDAGAVASVVTREIDQFNSLAEFQARFQFLDMNAFMAQIGVSSFEELKSRHRYLLTEIRGNQPPAFDPNDPANLHSLMLGVALLVRDTLDVGGGLRDAKLARRTMDRALAFTPGSDVADARTPYAPVVVFPQSAVAGPPLTAAAVQALFAAENLLALFVTPT